MRSRLQGILIGFVAGGLLAGTFAFAVTVVPSESGDIYYGCFSSAGKLKVSTVWFNIEPEACPSVTDVVRSWGAQGEVGPPGPQGPEGPPGPAATPSVRLVDVSAEITNQNVEIAPNQSHTYSVFDSADCSAISASVEGVSYSFSNFSSFSPAHMVLRTGRAVDMRTFSMGNSDTFGTPTGTGNFGLSPFFWDYGVLGDSITLTGIGPLTSLTVENRDGYRTLTVGRVHAYCYPY